jgi:hypothetical protein
MRIKAGNSPRRASRRYMPRVGSPLPIPQDSCAQRMGSHIRALLAQTGQFRRG